MYNRPLLCLASFCLAAAAISADAPPGSVDLSFDYGVGAFTAATYPYSAAAILPDSSVVLAGPYLVQIQGRMLTHVLVDGRYDYSYGTNLSLSGSINALAYQPGEGLLVAGEIFVKQKAGPFGIIRVDAAGNYDPTFVADTVPNQYTITRLTVLSDHGILLARTVPFSSLPITNRPPLIIKLLPNGRRDRNFNCHVTTVMGGAGVEATHVLGDGRLLVGGQFVTDASPGGQAQKLIRLLPDGQVDPGYEEPTNVSSGTLVGQLSAVEDGLLASVRGNSGADSVVRLHSDGSEDLFLSNYRLQPPMRYISGIWEQSDGNLIISGSSAQPAKTNLALVRIGPDGVEDTAYPARVGQQNGGAANGILPFPDGGLLVYGNIALAGNVGRPGFMRVLANGDPDPNFGRLGAVYINGSRENYAVTTLVPLHDGVLIAGKFQSVDGLPVNQLAKLRLDGAIDAAFSTNATAGQSQIASKISGFELPDGRVLLASSQPFINGRTNMGVVARLMADGHLDTTFKPSFVSQPSVLAAALQPDGNLLVAGHPFTNMPGHNLNVVRIMADGSIDPAFALPIPASVPANAQIAALAVHNDGRIVASTTGGFIARYTSSGERDANFQTFPKPVTCLSASIAILPDGSVYVSGYTVGNSNGLVQLAHWNPDGGLDLQFQFPLRGSIDEVQASGVDRIMVRGTFAPQTVLPRVVRCFADGNLDSSFGIPDRPEVVHAMAVIEDQLYLSSISRNMILSTNYPFDHVVRYSNRVAPFTLPVLNEVGGHFVTLNYYGPAGRHYFFDASSDLMHWTQIADEAIPTNGIVPLLDDLPADTKSRFYRARPVE